jgi:hypothetical protein
MTFFYLVPAYAGAVVSAFANPTGRPPVKNRLRCEFEVWIGDAVLNVFPCWVLVTESAKDAIRSAGLTGVQFDNVEVFKSTQFEEFEPDNILPAFAWLKVEGKAGHDDFGIAQNLKLVVSQRALKLLQRLGIPRAKVSDFKE